MVDEQEHSDDVRDLKLVRKIRSFFAMAKQWAKENLTAWISIGITLAVVWHGCVADMEKQIIRQDEQLVALREKIASAYETNRRLEDRIERLEGLLLDRSIP